LMKGMVMITLQPQLNSSSMNKTTNDFPKYFIRFCERYGSQAAVITDDS
jgi:hypothetical protein